MSTKAPFPQRRSKRQAKQVVERPYRVIVIDDSVNLFNYLTYALSKIFGYSAPKVQGHVKEINKQGQSTLWTGVREKAELYVYLLQEWQLNAYLKRDE